MNGYTSSSLLDLNKDTESRIALSLNWPKVRPFAEFQFLNFRRFTSTSFGISYLPYHNLKLFGYSRNNFESEECQTKFGAEYMPNSNSSVKLTCHWDKDISILINHRFNSSMAVICNAVARPPSDTCKPLDIGIGIKIDV